MSHLADLKGELSKAETQLSQLSAVLQNLKVQADSLDTQRDSLEHQVAKLEEARDRIALNLRAASKLIASPPPGRLQKIFGFLFSGVPGDIVAAAILAVVALFYRKLRRNPDLKAVVGHDAAAHRGAP